MEYEKIKLYSEGKNYKLYNGSMLDMLEVIEPNSIDSIVTDPPYELNFMNKGWDNSGVAFQKDTWEHCFKVLKEGGYLLAFGGSRTFHRIAVAIEDAGFEIRDTIMWLYGSGFPKSMNLSKGLEARQKLGNAGTRNKRKIEQACDSEEYTLKQSNNGIMGEIKETTRKKYIPNTDLAKQWEGWGTNLKPAYEPIIVARKPFKGSLVENIMQNGVGGLNIDECRVAYLSDNDKKSSLVGFKEGQIQDTNVNFLASPLKKAKTIDELPGGRFPANVILTYDETDYEEVCGGMPYTASVASEANWEKSNCDSVVSFTTTERKSGVHFGDEGSAARYYYCAKASKKDRDEGLTGFEEISPMEQTGRKEHSLGLEYIDEKGQLRQNPYAGTTSYKKNIHPTVKPTELMQYLVRLVSPKGATILDCFNGSGSTGKAVMFENRERDANYKYIGIELTPDYLPIAKARIEFAIDYVNDEITIVDTETQEKKQAKNISIFDLIKE